MFENKTLNQIGERFFCDRKEFKIKERINVFERLSTFIPGASLFGFFSIRNKIKKEIQRAEKESNTVINFNLENNVITWDSLNKYVPIIFNCVFFTCLFIHLLSFQLGFLNIILLSSSSLFFILLGIIGLSIPQINSLEHFINRQNYREDESLSERDMVLLKENIPDDVLENFLVKKDFRITYYSLWDLQEELKNYDQKKQKLKKAKEIIVTLSSKVKEAENV